MQFYPGPDLEREVERTQGRGSVKPMKIESYLLCHANELYLGCTIHFILITVISGSRTTDRCMFRQPLPPTEPWAWIVGNVDVSTSALFVRLRGTSSIIPTPLVCHINICVQVPDISLFFVRFGWKLVEMSARVKSLCCDSYRLINPYLTSEGGFNCLRM